MKTKVLFTLLFAIFLSIHSFADIPPALEVEEYTLENGLTVYLNPDHSQPNMMGSVVIRGGAKRDPIDATGIAHYFEHIMFKGTENFGTIDYKAEKPYLDSIEVAYDLLAEAKTEEEKAAIQLTINRLNIEAAKYAIPNEFDKMMVEMGGTRINAYTSWENIVYHNVFQSNQIEKWLKVYYDRFENPVFRLFQSELETVYEEKNMYADDPFNALIETYYNQFYKKHPYGQQTILGSIEHLKTPSLSKMKEYYDTYYVANNMALILTGSFDPEEVKPLIEQTFGKLRTGEIPAMPVYEEKPFEGKEVFAKRMTPIKVGIMGYRTVEKGHPDEIKLEVANNLLSNSSSSGLVDQLRLDNKLMMAFVTNDIRIDMGGTLIFFIPKVFGQSHKKAENYVLNEIEKIKNGNFDEELFEGVKLNLLKGFYEKLEVIRWRSYFITDAFLVGEKWEDYLKYPEELKKITKQDVIDIANKYYGDNRLVLYSKMGFPKKEKLDKPPYKPVSPENTEEQSDFAKQISDIETKDSPPQFIDLGEEVELIELKEKVNLYVASNPINDIFSLRLQFGTGTYYQEKLKSVVGLLEYCGTTNHKAKEFKQEMHKLGASYYAYTQNSYFVINLSGLEKNLDKTLTLFNDLLTSPVCTGDDIKKVSQDFKINARIEKKDPGTLGNALYDYARYETKSEYLNRQNAKEIKNETPESLLNLFHELMRYEVDLHYCGKLPAKEVANTIEEKLVFNKNRYETLELNQRDIKAHNENTIYFIDHKKAIQSKIYFIVEGNKINEESRTISYAYNKYFGGNMNSIVFQEIREFRSLAYASWARYYNPDLNGNKGYLTGFVGTQADKTTEAIDIFYDILTNMPERPERLDMVKSGLMQEVNSSRPSFRNISNWVAYWNKQGYHQDPRRKRIEKYETLTFDEIVTFFENQIKGKPVVIAIVGDSKRINMEELVKYGKVIELHAKDVIKL